VTHESHSGPLEGLPPRNEFCAIREQSVAETDENDELLKDSRGSGLPGGVPERLW